MHEVTQVGAARRVVAMLAETLAFDDESAGRAALVCTELGNNLVRHAHKGRLLVGTSTTHDGSSAIDIVSLDHGPGIADTATCMRDGYSTAGTPGNGMGAIERMSDEFDLYSAAPAGTVILSRIVMRTNRAIPPRDGSAFAIGTLAIAAPGERVCGDAWSFVQEGQRGALCVADGLGHGGDAAVASNLAIDLFESDALEAPARQIGRMHPLMRTTRGAAVAIAQLDMTRNEVVVGGAGNIVCRLVSGLSDRTLMTQHGTVGVQIGRQQDMTHEWPRHALLVMHSDGIATRWNLDDAPGILMHHPVLVAAWLLRGHCRGRDDATVVVVKRKGGT